MTFALALLPAPAWAEVCEKLRPGWEGGPVSMVDEAISIFTSPLSLILLVATAFAFRFRSQWATMAVCAGWSLLVTAFTFFDPTGGLRRQAEVEGCIGSPALFIALAGALCVGLALCTGTPAKKE